MTTSPLNEVKAWINKIETESPVVENSHLGIKQIQTYELVKENMFYDFDGEQSDGTFLNASDLIAIKTQETGEGFQMSADEINTYLRTERPDIYLTEALSEAPGLFYKDPETGNCSLGNFK